MIALIADQVRAFGDSSYAQVALLIFVAAFAAIVVRTWLLPRSAIRAMAELALEGDERAAPGDPARTAPVADTRATSAERNGKPLDGVTR